MAEPIRLVPYDPTWAKRYEAERRRILASLGEMVEGGMLDGLEHVGSTSIPGMTAKPCLDIVARVHPLPLPDEKREALEALGYTYRGENGIPGREYFTKGPHEVHLHIFGFDTEHWARHVLFRDYLRVNAEAAGRYQALKLDLASRFSNDRAAYTEGKTELVQKLEREAFAWHVAKIGFKPVEAAVEELKGLGVPWLVSSGWALDLFLSQPARYHDDLDIVIFRDDQLAVQQRLLERGWRLDKVVQQETLYRPWTLGETAEAKVTQIHARRDGVFMDLLLSPRNDDGWVYRRDERIALGLERAILRSRGVPHLAPEAVLLFKSRSTQQGKPVDTPRDKDQEDFERVLPHLSAQQQAWLADALRVTKPDHPWLEQL